MNCIVYGIAKSRTWLKDFHFSVSYVMVAGGGVFRRQLGQEGGAPMNGISAL